jgi:microcystin-dependent protein
MADPFVAEIRMFGFNFAPRGWAFCNGQLIPISQNTALFSLLGTNYGGDGRTNFALPNLQSASALGADQGPGLSLRSVGESGGSAAVSLLESQVPAHSHALRATTTATSSNPAGAALAPVAAGGGEAYRSAPNATTFMGSDALTAAGGTAHNNRQPYLALNFCIALQGVFPPRP